MLICADNTLYTGITTNIERRVMEHNDGALGAKYTRVRRPVRVVYQASFENRSEASREESRIKKMTKSQKEEFINKNT